MAMMDSDHGSDMERKNLRTDLIAGIAGEKRIVTTYADDFYWRCEVCGWLGKGCSSLEFAMHEGRQHFDKNHPQAVVQVERHDIGGD